MQFIAVRGSGKPNEERGRRVSGSGYIFVLYQISHTIRMTHKNRRKIEGYFLNMQPPLDVCRHLAWQESIMRTRKHFNGFQSVCRILVTKTDFDWAVEEAARKREQIVLVLNFSPMRRAPLRAVLCILAPMTRNPRRLRKWKRMQTVGGYDMDMPPHRASTMKSTLNDARKCAPEKLKTVIRHPVKKR